MSNAMNASTAIRSNRWSRTAIRARPLDSSAAIQAATRSNIRNLSSAPAASRSEEHTSELQSLMRISYAVFCLKKKKIAEGKAKITQDEHAEKQDEITETTTR